MLIRSLPLVLLALVSAALHAETPTFNKGKELILLNVSGPGGFGYNQIYVAGGTNPISDQAWETYEADFGYFKNPTRRALFVNSPFLSSPTYPDGVKVYYTDTQGYTWLWNTQNRMAIDPFPQSSYPNMTQYQAGGTGANPPGTLQVFVNWKNQVQTFPKQEASGQDIVYHFITDPNGDEFILGAIDYSYDTPEKIQAEFDQVQLPKGWSKSSRALSQDLVTEPTYASTGGNYEAEYNQLRDANLNNYFQIRFSSNGNGVYQNVPGMAIYAGNGDERRNGTATADFIHGGAGHDLLYGYQNSDTIYGDDGNDRIFGGPDNDYLFGGTGNDRMDGQQGRDAMTGNEGADTFMFTTQSFGSQTADQVTDYSSTDGDKVFLSLTVFKKRQEPIFIKSVDSSIPASKWPKFPAFLVYDTSTGSLYYNANGSLPGWGDGGLFAAFANTPTLTESDFLLK